MSAGELLLEVRAEEIPARMLPGAARELATRLFEELVARGLAPSEVESGFTPRRLWLILRGVPARESDRQVVEVGPPAAAAFDADGRPTAAAVGFARKFGVEPDRLVRRDLTKDGAAGAPKGERVVLERRIEGRPTRDLLAELLPQLLRGLAWAKTMRWGSGVGPWVRPVHGVVALVAGEVVPFELFGVASGRTTVGHPTLSPASFAVSGADDWRRRLASLRVEPSPEARLARLRGEMERRAAALGGTLFDDPELLAKLAAICEIPGVLEGRLDDDLLALPREVLATSLRDHQSALTVERDGELLPVFLTLMDRPDDPAGHVRAGNEWVVAARLADARFFWGKDRAQPLSERVAALDGLGFHQKLGSYGDKRIRVEKLCATVAATLALPAGEAADLSAAAHVAKADLATDMVREFTSLQGVMGGIYAREQGLPEPVWTAIYDQYLPASAEDPLPRGRGGRILALADRVDTLVGFFGLGLVPTGSRDPFGLRRAAIGALRLAPELGSGLDLVALVGAAHAGYGDRLARDADATWALLRPFLEDRLRYLLELEGFAYDEIEAALQRAGETLAAVAPIRARVAALHAMRASREFLSVVLAAKRIANIVRDQPAAGGDVAAPPLEPAETALAAAAEELDAETRRAEAEGDFPRGFAAVARIAPPLEAFFTDVLVLDPDPAKRAGRVALLQRVGAAIGRLAELSALVVDKSGYR